MIEQHHQGDSVAVICQLIPAVDVEGEHVQDGRTGRRVLNWVGLVRLAGVDLEVVVEQRRTPWILAVLGLPLDILGGEGRPSSSSSRPPPSCSATPCIASMISR